MVVTGRGGKHFYYRYPDTTIGNRAGILGRKIDVRGEGGLVVAPPSVHPETKREYIFEPWGYYCLEEIPFFDPAWLGEEEKERGKPANLNGDIRSGVRYIQKIRAISGEGGHNATFRAACKLRDSGLTEEEALDVLLSWNETNCEPRWTQRELLHKVQSSFRRAAP